MRTQVLLPWTTLNFSGTFVQGAEGWLDLGDYTDAAFWVELAGQSFSNTTVTIESSPSWDDAFFQPIGPPITFASLGGGPTFVVYNGTVAASTTPLSRWVRCRVAGGGGLGGPGTSMLRIRACPMRQARFVPTKIPGCVLWLSSDLGATTSPAGWSDSSDSADPNQKLVPAGGYSSPTYTTRDPDYANRPSWSTASGATLVSAGAWATPLQQPATWVVVAKNNGAGGSNQFLIDADDASTGQSIQYNPTTSTLQIFANGAAVSTTQSWTTPSAFLGEWNGGSSNIYFNNFTTPIASGTVGGGVGGSQGSMTLMAENISLSPGSFWLGSVAEIIAYSGILSPTAKAQLRLYLNNRYNLSIT